MQESTTGPLAGIRILDLTEVMSGPYCTAILADMGAEVLKVERPGSGDVQRAMGDGSERNPYFRFVNRNKRSITLDYKTPAGREILLRLVDEADVLAENYRSTVMERAGLGWDVLHARNPRLIYAQISGFGSTGPYRHKGGFDLIAQGIGGLMHVTGETDGPPTSVGLPICDVATGMWTAQAVLAALYARERTGEGQHVECSLMETAIAFSSLTSAGWLADGIEPKREGSRHRQSVPYQRFSTSDGYIMVGAGNQKMFRKLAGLLGHPEWPDDPRFINAAARRRNRPALEALIQAELSQQTSTHWIDALDTVGVPCGPIYNYAQLFSDPQVVHRKMVVHADDPELGRVAHLRMPILMSGSDVSVRTVAPRLGQHTREVLSGLGYDDAAVERLRREGAI